MNVIYMHDSLRKSLQTLPQKPVPEEVTLNVSTQDSLETTSNVTTWHHHDITTLASSLIKQKSKWGLSPSCLPQVHSVDITDTPTQIPTSIDNELYQRISRPNLLLIPFPTLCKKDDVA